jgi:ABC-type Mn2+/Zn2+ transport system ATPase subunit
VSASSDLPEGKLALEARSLSVGHGRRAVVAGIDFAIERGKTLALIGSNGSGKTTLLKTMASLLQPVSGVLRVLGAAPGAFPARVAYLGQLHASDFILPLRSIDVVRMARFAGLGLLRRPTREDGHRVEEAVELMGVAHLRNEPFSTLSGGQRQRVLLAQALARGAELLLLDEPAANLDGTARETYRKAVRAAVAADCSAVIVTHDIDEAAACDYAMLLSQRGVAFGRGRDLLASVGCAMRSVVSLELCESEVRGG